MGFKVYFHYLFKNYTVCFEDLNGLFLRLYPGLHPGLLDFALSGLCVMWLVFTSRGFTPGYWISPFQGFVWCGLFLVPGASPRAIGFSPFQGFV